MGVSPLRSAFKIGVSGHRHRDGADWAWVRSEMDAIIVRSRNVVGYTSLAPGADQLFAEAILDHGAALIAVVPVFQGRIELEEEAKGAFDRLYERAKRTIRVRGSSRDDAFLRAGRRVADAVNQMIFVWDGGPSRGLGGTADIVDYAIRRKKTGIILDPISRSVRTLG